MLDVGLALSSLVAVHSRARGAHRHLATSTRCLLRIALPFDMAVCWVSCIWLLGLCRTRCWVAS